MHTSKKLAWQQKCGVPEAPRLLGWYTSSNLPEHKPHKLPSLSLSPHFCFQLINAVSSLDRTVLNQLHVQLMELRGCKGHKQCNPRTRSVEPGKTNTHTPWTNVIHIAAAKQHSFYYSGTLSLFFLKNMKTVNFNSNAQLELLYFCNSDSSFMHLHISTCRCEWTAFVPSAASEPVLCYTDGWIHFNAGSLSWG